MDWDKLRVFHAVAEAGSFTHAGETLNLSQSAVSRQISGLEERLRVPLFHRHARGLILTEQGEILYRTTREIFSKLAMTEAMLAEGREKPKGPLKITTTVAFGSTWLTPNIKSFVDAYPEIAVTLLVDDNELDLSMREADVAIRMAPPRQPDLIQRHLMNIHFHLYASPAYLEQFGEPKNAAELGKHRLIIYGERSHLPFPDANWLLHLTRRESGVATLPALTVNNYYAIYRACITGIGIAALPDYMVRQSAELQQVLPEVEGPQVPAYFVYPEELRNSKRITVLREFLLQNVANQQF